MNNFKKIDLSSPLIKQLLLAVSLLLVVVLCFILLIIMPLVSKLFELNEIKSNLVIKLQQYERILAKADLVTASMVNINKEQENQGYFNLQETDALASADMQEFIKKTIVDAGGQLSSTQALPVSSKDNFRRITVSVRMTGSSQILRKVLYTLETSKPLIIINQIDIRPIRGTRNRMNGLMEASNDLNVNFQAVSFMRNSVK